MTALRWMTWAVLALAMLVAPVASARAPEASHVAQGDLLILSYHDIRDDVARKGDADAFAIGTQNFAAHLDWLAGHGYAFVSLADVIAAARGGTPLPRRAVLLTFDDGLRSVYTHAFPLLRAYRAPAVVAVVTDWVDLPEGASVDYGHRAFDRADFLTWPQLREMHESGLVEVASHSANLHRGVQSNPQGNNAPAAITRIYDTQHGYEDEASYRSRVHADLARSAEAIERHVGRRPRAIVWPYAAYSAVTNAIADGLGMQVSFDLEGRSTHLTTDLHGLARLLVMDNPTIDDLAYQLRHDLGERTVRALHVDLDAVYDPDPAQIERNLDALVERVNRVGPSQVFLQAFADPDGNGSADALYFPNRHLPMRADLFNRVAWQLKTRAEVQVFGWMPVLGFELPAQPGRDEWAIRGAGDEIHRLDFTRPEVRGLIRDVYENLAVAAHLDGLLFHDDAYLRDTELTGRLPAEPGSRTRALIDFTLELEQAAEQWRPKLLTARNLYARTVLEPRSEAWFAQRLDAFNAAYDYTAVMAMPWMEGNGHAPERWLDALLDAAREQDPDLDQTVFELQTVDWATRTPIPGERLVHMARRLRAAGVRHLAWYPDDFIADQPRLPHAREAMSRRAYPYEER